MGLFGKIMFHKYKREKKRRRKALKFDVLKEQKRRGQFGYIWESKEENSLKSVVTDYLGTRACKKLQALA